MNVPTQLSLGLHNSNWDKSFTIQMRDVTQTYQFAQPHAFGADSTQVGVEKPNCTK